MRGAAWVIPVSFLLVGCADDGGGGTTASTQPTTQPTTVTLTGPGETTVGDTTEQPTGSGGVTGTGTTAAISDSDPSTSTGPGLTTTIDPGTTTTTGDPPVDTTTTGDPPVDTTTTTEGDTTTTSTTSTTDPETSTGVEMMSSTGEDPCQVVKATLKPVVPNVMLVLDKSGSMLIKWDHDANAATGTITRWNSLYQVVDSVLTKFNNSINFGANLFPSTSAQNKLDATACLVNANVEISVAPKNKDSILANIPAALANTLQGGTPASAGMTAALNHLKGLNPAKPRAVLLITDGAANCTMGAQFPALFETYDQSVHTIVDQAWTVDKIPTYVIGIDIPNMVTPVAQDGNPDNINPAQKLNDLAIKGGKPKNDPAEKFYNANNQIELSAALDAVIADALSCVIPLAVEPAKPELVEVLIQGALVPKVDSCANQDGWVFVNPNGPYNAIELCGAACNGLKQAGNADVNFYCVPG